MNKTLFTVITFSLALVFSAKTNAQQLFDYQKSQLDNGMMVISLEDFSTPIVSVQIWYHVGSKNEDPNRQGFAHMFEHMMFRGTERTGPEQHFSLIRKVGGTVNGYTSFDKTVYLQTLPAEQLELVLWLEAERMAFLKIDRESFDTERKVVEEELRVKLNEPYGTTWEKLFDGMFKVHPYQWLPIGQISHLRSSTVSELQDFWLKYYGPENATLIIVGAVKHEKAHSLAKKHFSWIDSHQQPQRVKVREPYPDSPQQIIIEGEHAPAPVAGISWLTIPSKHPDTIALDLLTSIWGQGKSSIAYKKLVNETKLAVGAEAGTYSLQQAGILGAGATLNPALPDPNAVIKILKEQIAEIRNNGVNQADLQKAKNQMLRDQITTNLEIENKAKFLGFATVELGDTNRVNTIMDEIKKVTTDDIKRVANKYLTDDKIYVIQIPQNLTGPFFSKNTGQENTPLADTNEPIKAIPGRGSTRRPADYPENPPFAQISKNNINIETRSKTLKSGLKVLVVPNDEVPFITVQLGSKYGAWSDPKPGTCSMAMSMLDKGTENYSADKLALELEKRAISLSASADMDSSSIILGTISQEIDKAIQLLAEVATHPVFPQDEFEKQKQKTLTALSVEQHSPEFIADKYFKKAVYGDHPYSLIPTGEIEDINELTTDICRRWWSKYFNRPEDKTLIFAGDIKAEKAFELAQKYFGKWKSTKIALRSKPAVKNTIQGKHVYLIDNPDSQQSQIRVGHLGITRKQQPQYFTSRIVSDYFGFGFNSRLNKSIRIKKGLTYAVWGGYFARDVSGDFRVQTFSKTKSTPDAIIAILDELEKLKTVKPDPNVLADSKSYIAGSFVRNRETPQQVARDLWLIESQGLKPDYLDRLLNSVKNTTIDDCMELVENISPENIAIIVVGDAKKLKTPLEKIAPITLIEDEF